MYRSAAQPQIKNYQADLGDDRQVVGHVYLRRSQQLSYEVYVRNLRRITAVRLRLGSSGGPIVAYLYGPTRGKSSGPVSSSGIISSSDLRGPLKGRSVNALVTEMDQGRIWADAATRDEPYGAAVGRVYRRKR